MTAKELAIKESYGEHWDMLKDKVDIDGWCYGYFGIRDCFTKTQMLPISKGNAWRPDLIREIDTNNNWVKIESEADLPTKEGSYFVYSKVDWGIGYRIDIFTGRLSNTIHHETGEPIFSHYQEIIKPKPPIY